MKYILVDYENVHDLDYSSFLKSGMVVKVFVGESQAKITTDFAMLMQKYKDLLFLSQISGNGKNALDFHIAYEMGRIFCTDQSAVCYVFSKDTGYDPLIENIRKQYGKKHCYRVDTLSAIPLPKPETSKAKPAAAKSVAAKPQPAPKKTAQSKNNTMTWDMVLKLLKGQKTLSTKKSSLAASIQSWAKQKKLKLTSADKIIEELQKNKHLEVLATGKIKYLL
ncbi:MAG: PIN domain-containing protein [Fibrobacter sp.]|nr:PIN domain-containing protein [Fibrobacter sp.]